jgi:hypothetical protein
MILSNLQDDCLTSVFRFLDFLDLSRIRRVCSKFDSFLGSSQGRTHSIFQELFQAKCLKNYQETYNPINSVFSLPPPFNFRATQAKYLCGHKWEMIEGSNFTTFINPKTGHISFTRNIPIPNFIFKAYDVSYYAVKQSNPADNTGHFLQLYNIVTNKYLGKTPTFSNKIIPDVRNSHLIPYVDKGGLLCMINRTDLRWGLNGYALISITGNASYVGSRGNYVLIITTNTEKQITINLIKCKNYFWEKLFKHTFDNSGENAISSIYSCNFNKRYVRFLASNNSKHFEFYHKFISNILNRKIINPLEDQSLIEKENRYISPTYIDDRGNIIKQKAFGLLSEKSFVSIQKKEIHIYDVDKGLISKRPLEKTKNEFYRPGAKTVGEKPVKIEIIGKLEKVIIAIHSFVILINRITDAIGNSRLTYLPNFLRIMPVKFMFFALQECVLFNISFIAVSINFIAVVILKIIETSIRDEHTKWLADQAAAQAYTSIFTSFSIVPMCLFKSKQTAKG